MTIFTPRSAAAGSAESVMSGGGEQEVYPGWGTGWVPGRVVYRVLTQPSDFEAYLMNIE